MPSSSAALQLHGPAFAAIADLGHMVLCLTPEGDSRDGCDFDAVKAETGTFNPKPEGWSVLQSRRAVQALSETLKDWRAQTVLSSGSETTLLAALAAKSAGITNHIAVVTECVESMGDAAKEAWRKALVATTSAVFLNRDDKRTAVKAGLLSRSCVASVVSGAGVDLVASAALPLPAPNGDLTFFIHGGADLRGQNKILTEAATALTAAHPNVRVIISGAAPTRSETVPERITHTADFSSALTQCHVYVHVPGSHALPATLLEALAAGRPIITANTAGCRETVDELVNGCLVEPGSAAAVTKAMKIFVARPDLIATASRASRLKAERRFDRREMTQDWLKVMALQV